jgi:cation transport ATPase
MVSEAQRSRAPIQRLADVVSAWFVPAVVLIGEPHAVGEPVLLMTNASFRFKTC